MVSYIETLLLTTLIIIFEELHNLQREEIEFGVITFAYVSFRFVVQDSGNVPDRLLRAVLGPVHVLHQSVQHVHEDILHRLHCLHYLPDAI